MPIWPREDEREPLPHVNEHGDLPTRVFRVTSRDIDEATVLVLAHDPEEAAAGKAQMISSFDRQHIHETVEVIEYRPAGTTYSAPSA